MILYATIVAEKIKRKEKERKMQLDFQKLKKKFIGSKEFYRGVLTIVIPMIIQNGISNFVNMLDNIMVGSLGTEQMSGVSIVNQFTFVFILLVFGGVSGAGIFTAQFYGKGDVENIRNTFRAKLIIVAAVSVIGVTVFSIFDEAFINMFLHESDSTGNIELTLQYGKDYLKWIIIGLVPFAIGQAYASNLRETGNTFIPMVASVSAVLTNLVFNALLIYGIWFFPELGVVGAAIATTLSRFLEFGILAIYTHTHTKEFPYIVGAYKSFRIPRELMAAIAAKGLPIMANEFLWSLSITIKNQSFSTCGLDVVAGVNIASTIINLMNVVFLSLGSSIAIIVGKQLGAGKIEEAKDSAYKMLAFSVFGATCMSLIQVCISPLFPLIYNTSDEVRSIATFVIIAAACAAPFNAFCHGSYFTLRSGGLALETFVFDAGYAWLVVVPTAFIISRFTGWGFEAIYISVVIVEALKCIIGVFMVKSERWARQIVSD